MRGEEEVSWLCDGVGGAIPRKNEEVMRKSKAEDQWKLKIRKWCREWRIPEPTFILKVRELKKALIRGKFKWLRFKAQYPQVFNANSNEEEVKDLLTDTYARMSCIRLYGLNKGMYFTDLDLGIDILVMSDRYVHNEQNLKHEFFHVLNNHRSFCGDSDEEQYADYFSKTGKIKEEFKRK